MAVIVLLVIAVLLFLVAGFDAAGWLIATDVASLAFVAFGLACVAGAMLLGAVPPRWVGRE